VLRISTRTAWQRVRDGSLRATRLGGRVFVKLSAIRRALDEPYVPRARRTSGSIA
jgi:hypothetical protein